MTIAIVCTIHTGNAGVGTVTGVDIAFTDCIISTITGITGQLTSLFSADLFHFSIKKQYSVRV